MDDTHLPHNLPLTYPIAVKFLLPKSLHVYQVNILSLEGSEMVKIKMYFS